MTLISSNQPDNAEKNRNTQQDQQANDDFNSVCHGSKICRSHADASILLRKNKKAPYRFDSGLASLNYRWYFANILGWLMGLEPTTTGITILDSTN